MLLGIIRQCLKRKKLIAEIRTDDITIENPVIKIFITGIQDKISLELTVFLSSNRRYNFVVQWDVPLLC
jgi:hypothetical protein